MLHGDGWSPNESLLCIGIEFNHLFGGQNDIKFELGKKQAFHFVEMFKFHSTGLGNVCVEQSIVLTTFSSDAKTCKEDGMQSVFNAARANNEPLSINKYHGSEIIMIDHNICTLNEMSESTNQLH